jgi:hypothetical protein
MQSLGVLTPGSQGDRLGHDLDGSVVVGSLGTEGGVYLDA